MKDAKKQSLGLNGLDELFMTDRERAENKLPRIYDIPLSEIDDFPDHPFKVRMDEDMDLLVQSVKERGVIVPITLREKEDGRYELVSGHRRKKACELAGFDTIRAEIRDLTRDEAIILMVESNLQRSVILPSEKAYSYKMRLEAMKRQAGRPSKENVTPVVSDFERLRSNEELGVAVGESREQIRRYIRLTELIPPLLDMVDDGRIGMRPAVELSYGTTTFRVSFKYPNDPQQISYSVGLSGFRYHYLNGQMAYCLEPQAGSTPGAVYSQIAGGAELNVWERFLSISQRNTIALALAYGAPNGLNSTTKLTLHGYEAATQVIIWELIIGYRNTSAPFACTNSGLYNFVLSLCNPNDSTGTLRAAYISGYNSIVSSMQSHGVIPSFASKKQAQAPEHEMAYDAASGLYRIVLTDSNNAINNDFPYTSGSGLTFTKSGNRLTVTATAEALRNQPVMVSATGSDPDTDNVSPVIWGTTNSNHNVGQILSQLAKPDPVHVYFKLKGPSKTDLTIQKVSEDGNIGGITFTVTDSGGNVLFIGQTDQNGRLNVPDLEVGKTITVTETVPENYVAENRVQTLTLAASGNTVSFRNYPLGTATMRKVSDGGDVAGYCFRLYRHKSGDNSGRTWCGKSDTDGRVYETDGDFNVLGSAKFFEFKGLTDGKYSFRELLSLHGAGNVWPERITLTTSGGSTPACNLSFTGEQLVAQENGDCTVSGIELTGLDGGGTLTITIKNEPVPVGSITVRKVDESGKAMEGVSFLLEYSTDDGSAWAPVTSRGETEPMTPGSCTSAGLKNGVLVTGGDGLAVFTGLCVETDSGPILYRLTETETRPGYSLLAGPAYEGPLPEGEAHDVTLTAVNMPEFQMPMTGGRGFGFTIVGVFVALLSATALLILLRKKRKNESI